MGSKVVIDNTLCYLVNNSDDEIFIFPRCKFEPGLRTKLTSLSSLSIHGVKIPDEHALNYLGLTPWGGQSLNGCEKYRNLEEAARKIIINNLSSIEDSYKITKDNFEKADALWVDPKRVRSTASFNPVSFGAQQLLNLFEGFAWVSKTFTIECFSVGNDRDYDFNIYEKSSLSMFGKPGKLIHHFRWSEFIFLEVTEFADFTVNTVDGPWGAAMGRGGFRKR
jgi:hypothetical protein